MPPRAPTVTEPGYADSDSEGDLRNSHRIAFRVAAIAAVCAACSIAYAPYLLAFPYEVRIGDVTVYSEMPITPRLNEVLQRADTLLDQSQLNEPHAPRDIYLTSGGWRWRVLALQSAGAFGLRRPFTHALVFNRVNIAADQVGSGRDIGGVRTLSGVIAHETTHLLVARHIGELRAAILPAWVKEGYPDHVEPKRRVVRTRTISTIRDPYATKQRRCIREMQAPLLQTLAHERVSKGASQLSPS